MADFIPFLTCAVQKIFTNVKIPQWQDELAGSSVPATRTESNRKSGGNCMKCVYSGALAASTPVLTSLLPCTESPTA